MKKQKQECEGSFVGINGSRMNLIRFFYELIRYYNFDKNCYYDFVIKKQ